MANTKHDAKWDARNGRGTYGHNIHHGELKRHAKFKNGGNAESGQNLAAEKGVNGAKRILQNHYKKK